MNRNTDPFDWFRDHADAIFRWLGIIGLLVLIFVLLRWWAMRWGGWRRWAARLRREGALTVAAFTEPVRSLIRHRRALRALVTSLGDPGTWRDAELALAAAARDPEAGGRPYAALVGPETVTVLLAGLGSPEPWTSARTALPLVAVRTAEERPLVVALGAQSVDGAPCCVFLDLTVGPPVLSVDGDERASRALLQALAAQLDARLPDDLVTVAEGVHPGHAGPAVRTAYREARDTPRRLGLAPVLVAAELPDPLPPEMAAAPDGAPGVRTLVLGEARAYAWRLFTDRYGRVAVTGTPLLPRCDGLGRAVVRTLDNLPPVLPPASAVESAADLVEESEARESEATDATTEEEVSPAAHAGVAARPLPTPARPDEGATRTSS
ncbi:hypothetical protein [Streptomyces sp. CLI2509]|uniref:hypothetical protein n=1 Tax=Streptomyces sp. CLI2509 TaxID=1984801 RepID=UPI000BAC92A3|nr:hypothetical protein [Streptomyces sp. CLI2509]ASY36251.1 hypothetical protein CAC01_29105 [Streptomyces sp. CLI2509]